MGLQPPSTVGVASKDRRVSHQSSARISQETFDDAVRENMAELDMEEAEALADAIAQFEAQGIDLSNVLLQPPTAERDAHPVLRGLTALLEATRAGTDATRELTFGEGSSQSTMRLKFKSLSGGAPLGAIVEDAADGGGGDAGRRTAGLAGALDALAASCAVDGDEGKRNRALLGSRDGIDALSSGTLSLIERPELPSALDALGAGLRAAENRENIGIRGLLALYAVLAERPADAPVQAAALRACAAAMVAHEANRAALHEKCRMVPSIVAALRAHPAERAVVLAACAALRALTLQDDGRVALNKGFDRARAAAEAGCLPLLAAQLAGAASGEADLTLAGALLNTLSRLTASAKICETLVELHAMDTAVQLLRARIADASICRAACCFLAALAGDDSAKARLGEALVPQLAATALAGHTDEAAALDACAQLVAALTTRHAANCAAFADAAGGDALLGAMRRWPRHLPLHKRGALILRNLAVRVPEAVPGLLEQGAEPVLRAGMERSAELHDLAKAALRDMRCDVSLSQPWQGMPGESHTLEMGEDAPDTFGAYMDTDEAREAMRFAGFDTSQM
ncbi:hypothetical protein KFE25_013334 [Diacronema lutheri]|uniref:Armadillo repeat-containing protein 6 n=1 Tax=Diacronema lutheri TaxID=2081491 RepID=A0A8J5XG68_DIALT|nr:hypothetical protein KFE25_013334 [Diacronema lutheri]